ncbi:hypothetical protein PAAG_11475 [Paracoccidioides lutzii Pb01]|uniref:Uncharacterized protein n=1 Tax=Paracoccidioides lutzii (strain ATCC MYA-826 / Pb01) TaxID=502779 RepID=A0A0A2V1V6_PARBA|nr:hypothetical protein PAAG_11475 [Paracoccidioides lutzii Pb01]KGQ01756.1 hypothetical protein PAAG_11475 [Paracoccidioides lutzii Pb01]
MELLRQAFPPPPLPTANFTGKTVIVTGANGGLGKEAVKHFVRLGARVIGTTRSAEKGTAVLAEINAETNRPGQVSIWGLDYGSYLSVRAFCERVSSELERLDVLVLNAGVATRVFEVFEGDEKSVTVNVISTLLLALSILPKLQQTAEKYNTTPCLTVTSSTVHKWAKFPERNAADIFAALSAPNTTTMHERYFTSKLLQLLAIRELTSRTAPRYPLVVVNLVSPGLSDTALFREKTGFEAIVQRPLFFLFAWKPEMGSRTIVNAAVAGQKSHGVFINKCEIENKAIAPWIETDEGKRIQDRVWAELQNKLEAIQLGALSMI